MKSTRGTFNKLTFLLVLLTCTCCNKVPDNSVPVQRLPVLDPDYTNITIPPNIAPMNFRIVEEATNYTVIATSEKSGYSIKVSTSKGEIRFPMKAWKKLASESRGSRISFEIYAVKNGKAERYETYYMNVAADEIDPWLVYRLIFPGYYSWSHIRIMQRNLENFKEERVVDNQVLDNNCINCHSFNNNNPERFMVHIRGSKGGTYFVDNGKVTRTDPKVETMPGSATYPSWHPGGRYVAFSSNQVRQSFYAATKKSIEVYDIVSSMIVYDREKNLIRTVIEEDTANCMRTFPSWSPDGKYLYYCKATNRNPGSNPYFGAIENIHYNLVRKPFNADSCTFGKTEVVFDAAAVNKSASFPRISPDGTKLVFTLHDFGTFPIWHPEADLYLLDMQTGKSEKMALNSDFTESYHTWSHNGKWLVFSSKRSDGRSTRPYFSYINPDGQSEKPFILPQKDPGIYKEMIESFNIPELVTGKIKMNPRDFEYASRNVALKAMQGDKVEENAPKPKEEIKTQGGKPVHE
jgi:dipeptidyl aminopeptidase/acylaminoacyl peptidase